MSDSPPLHRATVRRAVRVALNGRGRVGSLGGGLGVSNGPGSSDRTGGLSGLGFSNRPNSSDRTGGLSEPSASEGRSSTDQTHDLSRLGASNRPNSSGQTHDPSEPGASNKPSSTDRTHDPSELGASDVSGYRPDRTDGPDGPSGLGVRRRRGRSGGRLRKIGEGGEFSSWWVGDRLVARFAPDPETSFRLRRELRVRDLVRSAVDCPVPRQVATTEWAPGLLVTLDERLTGESGENVPAPPEQLGRFLTELHAIPIAAAEAVGVPHASRQDAETVLTGTRRAADVLVKTGNLAESHAKELFATDLDAVTAPWRPCLTHADLKGEHLRVAAGRLTGVLDWTDAEIGDPATDVAGLVISIGAARTAECGLDQGVLTRGLLYARCGAINLLYARLSGADDSPLPLLRTQLSRSFS